MVKLWEIQQQRPEVYYRGEMKIFRIIRTAPEYVTESIILTSVHFLVLRAVLQIEEAVLSELARGRRVRAEAL